MANSKQVNIRISATDYSTLSAGFVEWRRSVSPLGLFTEYVRDALMRGISAGSVTAVSRATPGFKPVAVAPPAPPEVTDSDIPF